MSLWFLQLPPAFRPMATRCAEACSACLLGSFLAASAADVKASALLKVSFAL
jgi:hypothetical protein